MDDNYNIDETSRISSLDLYEDLLLNDTSQEKRLANTEVNIEKQLLREQNLLLHQQLSQTTASLTSLKKQHEVLEENFKCLLETAKRELERKNKVISRLTGKKEPKPECLRASSIRRPVSLKGPRITDEAGDRSAPPQIRTDDDEKFIRTNGDPSGNRSRSSKHLRPHKSASNHRENPRNSRDKQKSAHRHDPPNRRRAHSSRHERPSTSQNDSQPNPLPPLTTRHFNKQLAAPRRNAVRSSTKHKNRKPPPTSKTQPTVNEDSIAPPSDLCTSQPLLRLADSSTDASKFVARRRSSGTRSLSNERTSPQPESKAHKQTPPAVRDFPRDLILVCDNNDGSRKVFSDRPSSPSSGGASSLPNNPPLPDLQLGIPDGETSEQKTRLVFNHRGEAETTTAADNPVNDVEVPFGSIEQQQQQGSNLGPVQVEVEQMNSPTPSPSGAVAHDNVNSALLNSSPPKPTEFNIATENSRMIFSPPRKTDSHKPRPTSPSRDNRPTCGVPSAPDPQADVVQLLPVVGTCAVASPSGDRRRSKRLRAKRKTPPCVDMTKMKNLKLDSFKPDNLISSLECILAPSSGNHTLSPLDTQEVGDVESSLIISCLAEADSSSAQTNNSPQPLSKDPVKDDESLVKDNESLVKDDKNLEKDDESLVKDDESLVKDDESLVKDDESLVKDGESLVKDDESLIKGDESLVKDDKNLEKEDESLVKDDESLVLCPRDDPSCCSESGNEKRPCRGFMDSYRNTSLQYLLHLAKKVLVKQRGGGSGTRLSSLPPSSRQLWLRSLDECQERRKLNSRWLSEKTTSALSPLHSEVLGPPDAESSMTSSTWRLHEESMQGFFEGLMMVVTPLKSLTKNHNTHRTSPVRSARRKVLQSPLK